MFLIEAGIYSTALGIAILLIYAAPYWEFDKIAKRLAFLVQRKAQKKDLDGKVAESTCVETSSSSEFVPPAYTSWAWLADEKYFQLERRAIFSKTWIYITHASRFLKPGDYRTFEIVGFSFIVILGKDRQLRAFHNVCRHRAYAVTKRECGNSIVLGCRYHGWSYDTKGKLIKAPEFENVEGFDKKMNGLWELKIEIRNSLVLVNFETSSNVSSLDLGRAEAQATTELQWVSEWKIEGKVNWKLAFDNLSQGNAPEVSTWWSSFLSLWPHNQAQLCSIGHTALLRRLSSGQLLTLRILPQTPNTTIIECNIYQKSSKRTATTQRIIDQVKLQLSTDLKKMEIKQKEMLPEGLTTSAQDELSKMLVQHVNAEKALGAEIHPAAQSQSFTQEGRDDDDWRAQSLLSNPQKRIYCRPAPDLDGAAQAAFLNSDTQYPGFSLYKITHIICSPLRRTLQTALIGCKPILYDASTNPSGLRIIAWPALREWGPGIGCRKGSPREVLLKEFPHDVVDFTMVRNGWEENMDGGVEEGMDTRASYVLRQLWLLEAAARNMEQWQHLTLTRRSGEEDIEILLFGHADFFTSLTKTEGVQYANFFFALPNSFELKKKEKCESRKPAFDLVETEESKFRRPVHIPKQ